MADTENINASPNDAFTEVLGSYGYRVNQRCATVAASLVCWLGTNVGRGFLEDAALRAKDTLVCAQAYLMAWALVNTRRSFINAGKRALELMLISEATPETVPELSAADYEVAEHVVLWLGGEDGQRFLRLCEAEIKRQNHVESFQRHLSLNLKLAPATVDCVLKMAETYVPAPGSPAAAQ
jgi:hypothetical protein